ncbi:PREDICTED: zinc finger protein 830-like [Priapulus caudatus]|uniref:Zinc finger protein 830 n=1 Tax=Priapulus caudatus TaxID=37621 RepID=A0ABM1EB52_PRICU|nr:PREDICTED: zinc finger protein 830-like [Priapulus caudatus]
MSASTKKNQPNVVKLDQSELRRLMKSKLTNGQSKKKGVDSPHAKYNSLGQLYCTICSTQVKTDLLWPAHVNGRTHKQHIIGLNRKAEPAKLASQSPQSGLKRKSNDKYETAVSEKKQKGFVTPEGKSNETGLPADFFDSGKAAPSTSLLGMYSSPSSEDEDETPPQTSRSSVISGGGDARSHLPSDVSNSGVKAASTVDDGEEEMTKVKSAEDLPEGFFDDLKMDAKVRKIEYKDPLDEEWEKFQKVITEETHVSEAIVAEEDEVRITDRQIEEIDEQIAGWQKVTQLEKKHEQIKAKVEEAPPVGSGAAGEEEDDVAEEDLDSMLDWKSKGI